MAKAPTSKVDDESHAGSIPVSSADDPVISPVMDWVLTFTAIGLVVWLVIRNWIM